MNSVKTMLFTKLRLMRVVSSALILVFFVITVGIYSLQFEQYIPPEITVKSPGLYDYTGIIHMHTRYSDGGGTIDDVIDAAQKAGAQFVLISDHNTIQPFSDGVEGWHNGILTLAGVEISSSVGHILYYDAGGLFKNYNPQKAERLLQDNPGLDTLLIVAHPFHPRLSFSQWSYKGYGGMEIVNADVQWRDNSILDLLVAFFGSLWFQDASNHLVTYPARTIKEWDQLLSSRFVAGVGSADAHSNLKITKSWHLSFPSYLTAFRYVKTHILLKKPLTGELANDRLSVIRSIRQGHAYIELGNFYDPSGFIFTVRKDSGFTLPGDTVSLKEKADLYIQSPDTLRSLIRLFKNGELISEVRNKTFLRYETHNPGVYRAEVFQIRDNLPLLRQKTFPWIISNPIYVIN